MARSAAAPSHRRAPEGAAVPRAPEDVALFAVVFAVLLVVLDGVEDAVLMTEGVRPVVVTLAVAAVVATVDVGVTPAEVELTSAPVPQGIASPSVCVAFVGVVVAPESEAIAKRPVQVVLGAAGAVNW